MKSFPVTVTYHGTDTIKRLYNEACYPEELLDTDLAFTLLIVGGGRYRASTRPGDYRLFPRLHRKLSSDAYFPQNPPERTGVEQIIVQLISFDEEVAIDGSLGHKSVHTRLKEMGLRGLMVAELYAFGAQYKQEQRKYPIVGIGQGYYVTLSGNYAVGLTVEKGWRVANSFPTGIKLAKNYRFAATAIQKHK